MRIGQLKHRVEFQSLVSTPDGAGGFDEAWETAFSCWAAVRASQGRRMLETGQVIVRNLYQVTIRRDAGEVLESMSILYNGQRLVIKSVVEANEENRVWQITCETEK